MSKFLHNFLAGFGSIFEIAPEPRTHLRAYKLRDLERLRLDYVRVAKDVRVAFDRIDKPAERQLSFDLQQPSSASPSVAKPNSGDGYERSTVAHLR